MRIHLFYLEYRAVTIIIFIWGLTFPLSYFESNKKLNILSSVYIKKSHYIGIFYMEPRQHIKVYRDNIICVNDNFLRKKLGVKKSQADSFRRQVIDSLMQEELKNIVLKYFESKDINILNDYIETNGIPEECFGQEPTKRLIIEYILQENYPKQNFVLGKTAVKLLSRILYSQLVALSQCYQ